MVEILIVFQVVDRSNGNDIIINRVSGEGCVVLTSTGERNDISCKDRKECYVCLSIFSRE